MNMNFITYLSKLIAYLWFGLKNTNKYLHGWNYYQPDFKGIKIVQHPYLTSNEVILFYSRLNINYIIEHTNYHLELRLGGLDLKKINVIFL